MTAFAYPVDAVAGAPEYSGRMARQAQSVLLAGARSGRPFGGMSGVTPGTPDDTVTISGLTWTVKPHSGVLDVQAASEAGPYAYAVSVAETGSITASHATYARVGIIYVQLSDPAEDATSTPAVTIGYVAGTPSATPTFPALPARAAWLASVSQPKTGGGNATVNFNSLFTVTAGGVLPVRSKNGLPVSAVSDGQKAIDLTNGDEYARIGGAWVGNEGVLIAPPIGSMGAGWTWEPESYIRKRGSRVRCHLVLTRSTAIVGPQGVLTMPSGTRPPPDSTIVNTGLLVSGASPGFVGIGIVSSGLLSIIALSNTGATSMRFDFDYLV